jgi:hypothetical protein
VEKYSAKKLYGRQVIMMDNQSSSELMPPELIQLQKSGGYIRFFTRAGNKYGSCYGPHHIIDNKEQRIECYLGRVIDSQNNIFYSKHWGYFQFTIEKGFISKNYIYKQDKYSNQNVLNLRYGNIWLLKDIYHKMKFDYVLDNIISYQNDTLYALLAYKLTKCDNSFINVINWYQRSYTRILYPNAAVSSGSIGTYLQELGQSHIREKFFDLYHD